MKIIGRKILAESDVSPHAKKRLSLWIRQLADARWLSFAQMKASFPDAREIGQNQFVFPFKNSGIEVKTLACLDLGIFYIEKVIEHEASEK